MAFYKKIDNQKDFLNKIVHTYSRKLQLPELSPQGKSNEYFFFFMSLINDPYQMKKSN